MISGLRSQAFVKDVAPGLFSFFSSAIQIQVDIVCGAAARQNVDPAITIEIGTNQLVPDFDVPAVLQAIDRRKLGDIPRLWDGHATERVVEVLRGL